MVVLVVVDTSCCICCFFSLVGCHRDLHVLTLSFPTRRSSVLLVGGDLGSDQQIGRVLVLRDPRFERLDVVARGLEVGLRLANLQRSEEHTSELTSIMRLSYAVCCLKKKT